MSVSSDLIFIIYNQEVVMYSVDIILMNIM